MIQHQPPGIREVWKPVCGLAAESFAIQAAQVAADLGSNSTDAAGVEQRHGETPPVPSQPLTPRPQLSPGGTGIKGGCSPHERYARERAPSLFINMRQELAESPFCRVR